MFDKMGDAVVMRLLVARAGLHPDAEGDGTAGGDFLHHDPQTVTQLMLNHTVPPVQHARVGLK